MESNIISATFGGFYKTMTDPAWLVDHGMQLAISGIELPAEFECHFSNSRSEAAKRQIGADGVVTIPDEYFLSDEQQIYCWIYLHPTEDSGVTEYEICIPLRKRPVVDPSEPTQAQQDIVDQAIAALNVAMAATSADAEAAAQSAEAAAESAAEVEHKMPVIKYGSPITIADEVTVEFAADGDNGWYVSADNPITGMTEDSFDANAKYVITWDGVEYTEFAFKQWGTSDFLLIGNSAIIGYAPAYETTAPFVVDYNFGNTGVIKIHTTSDSASHTVSIKKYPVAEKKIVPKQEYEQTEWGVPLLRKGTGNNSFVTSAAQDASGISAFAEGNVTVASGDASHAEGIFTSASGLGSHCEGYLTKSPGVCSHAEGGMTTASGAYSHAEGGKTVASGIYARAAGLETTASGQDSFAQGYKTTASGLDSFAEGDSTTATGDNAHSAGLGTIANHRAQVAFGKFNVADPSTEAANKDGNYVEIVGNGTGNNSRSNARTLDWDGNEELAGSITLGKGTADETKITAVQLKALLALL